MTRKKGNTNVQPNNFGSDSRPASRGGFRWINVPLSDQDVERLDADDTTLAELATYLLSLGDDGIGFSVKVASDGKSIVASLYRSDPDGTGDSVGLSSFADTVRDACAGLVFKYSVKLGGELTVSSPPISGATRRFR